MSETIILASCFLPLTGENLELWTRLDRELHQHNGRLALLSTAPQEETSFAVFPLPYLLRHFAEWFPHAVPAPLPAFPVEGWEADMLRSDAAWANHAYDAQAAWPGFLSCRQVARTFLTTLAPGAVMLWNSTHPQTAIFQMEAWRMGLPVYAIERGLLPGTLMLDAWGIQNASDLCRHWLAHDQHPDASAQARFDEAERYYLSHRPQKYRQAGFGGGGAALRQELGIGEQKAVVFFGQGDAAGLLPYDERARRQNAPAFQGTRDCLLALRNAVAELPDTVLLFKPHPLDPCSYADATSSKVIRVDQCNVHALIDLADVVAAQFTTLQYEALIYGKPVLLLGRSAWWGRHCTYEVNQRADLLPTLRSALARESWELRFANAKNFLAWALDRYLVACRPEVPARHSLRDLAEFLARASWDSRHLPPANARLWQAAELMAAFAASLPEEQTPKPTPS